MSKTKQILDKTIQKIAEHYKDDDLIVNDMCSDLRHEIEYLEEQLTDFQDQIAEERLVRRC